MTIRDAIDPGGHYTVPTPGDPAPNPSGAPDGPLGSLYADKYRDIFLQYPLNLESAEENHWVRFDIKALLGAQIKQDEQRSVLAGHGFAGGLGGGGGGGSFLDRVVSGTAERVSALVTTALLAPVNIAKSVVNEYLNDLPPVLGGVGREFLGGFTSKGKARGLGSIMIYSPHTRQENLKFNWKGESLGQVGAAVKAAGGSGRAIGDIMRGDSETVSALMRNSGVLAEGAFAKLAGSALGANADALVSLTYKSKGQAINPHLEMFFENVDFRTFTFDFKLAPRNASEAKVIREIVNLFKYAAAPAYEGNSPGGVFFVYPNVFETTFFNEDQTHKIAQSALTSVSVNYTASGINSTFYDNYPLETQLNLTFTELEIMHKGKIDQGY